MLPRHLRDAHDWGDGARARQVPSPGRAGALPLIAAVTLQVTAIWADRRYLDMSRMAAALQRPRRLANQRVQGSCRRSL